MNKFIKKLQKAFAIHNVVCSYLPEEGSTYTHNRKCSAYNGMTGIVHHHNCGKRFMINTGSSWLTNIKP
jgi:hypothetical protein